ncbi:hypothetical protein L2E82_37424 [Cichorium intybus]|uniref:Uncharacterized protein n=1 Tax=Cichorium intybus TaxID=13427 RepID=A0ACB9AE05_CICIN|nr:hypothetical protein L2E82_37424 [Cichorium intybus]
MNHMLEDNGRLHGKFQKKRSPNEEVTKNRPEDQTDAMSAEVEPRGVVQNYTTVSRSHSDLWPCDEGSTPLELDSEIEKTAKRLRKQAKLRKKQQASQTASSSNPPIIDIWQDLSSSETEAEYESDNDTPHTPPSQINHIPMAENPPLERTLRQWATQDVPNNPSA